MPAINKIDASVIDLFSKAKSSVEHHYGEIKQLAHSKIPRQRFFDRYLFHMANIYAATAAAIWWRSPDGQGILRVSELQYKTLGLTGPYRAPHEQLVKFALGEEAPFIVKPSSAPKPGAAVSNPTDSFIVFGPIKHAGRVMGIMELFLGPRPVRGKTDSVRAGYLQFMQHAIPWALLYLDRQTKSVPVIDDFTLAKGKLKATENDINALREEARTAIEQTLFGFVGLNLGSVKENREFAKRISELLESCGLRIECPECKTAAIIRCQRSKSSPSGVFVFDHYLNRKRTFHGGLPSLPNVKVVFKPARQPRVDSRKAP